MTEENIKITGVFIGLYDLDDEQFVQVCVDVDHEQGHTYTRGRTMTIADAEELFVQALRMIRAHQKRE